MDWAFKYGPDPAWKALVDGVPHLKPVRINELTKGYCWSTGSLQSEKVVND
jgi:hypothetical protein